MSCKLVTSSSMYPFYIVHPPSYFLLPSKPPRLLRIEPAPAILDGLTFHHDRRLAGVHLRYWLALLVHLASGLVDSTRVGDGLVAAEAPAHIDHATSGVVVIMVVSVDVDEMDIDDCWTRGDHGG